MLCMCLMLKVIISSAHDACLFTSDIQAYKLTIFGDMQCCRYVHVIMKFVATLKLILILLKQGCQCMYTRLNLTPLYIRVSWAAMETFYL